VRPLTGFSAYHLIGSPRGGFWRVTRHPEPFDPPPAPPPVGEVAPDEDASGRWDAPRGEYRVLYGATEPEGALGEKLAAFMPNVAAVRHIESFLDDKPDSEYGEDYLGVGLDADDVESFGWLLAHAPANPAARFIDVWHPRTVVALFPHAAFLLRTFGLKVLDRRALADERRGFTRRLGGLMRAEATAKNGELRAAGFRYESRLPPGWECWALWEPLPIDADRAEVERVGINTPALRRAAELLGVVLRS
jgi:hypothetical protein